MNDQLLRDLQQRLARLERTAARFRAGEVTGEAPLAVALGGADTPYEDVRSVSPVGTGDQVAALLWGSDLLVLGEIGDGGPVHLVGGSGEPAFLNSWSNFDAARPAGFYRAGGRTYLQGLIQSGAVPSTAFELPAEYRHGLATLNFPVVANNAFGAVAVDSGGLVTPFAGSNVYVDLSSISFRHD